MQRRRPLLGLLGAVLAVCTSASGCCSCKDYHDIAQTPIPRELEKVSLPSYVIEPPDILLINSLRTVPLPPYKIDVGDQLYLQYVGETRPMQPLGGFVYVVEPEGTINLGPAYGRVNVQGKDIAGALEAVKKQLTIAMSAETVKNAQIALSLAQGRGQQQITGQHLVRPDGTIGLGVYGDVHLAGRTLREAKMAIEEQLSHYLENPEVSVDVYGYNHMVYYVVLDQGDAALQIIRLPATGNETVLDALAQVNGLPPLTTRHHVWLARPAPAETGCDQVMPVNVPGITQCAETATNYQVMPGDRIYVKTDPMVRLDQMLAKIYSPVERTLGALLLGSATYQGLRGTNVTGGTGNGGL
jgi:polysaccharide export outer membrane protein